MTIHVEAHCSTTLWSEQKSVTEGKITSSSLTLIPISKQVENPRKLKWFIKNLLVSSPLKCTNCSNLIRRSSLRSDAVVTSLLAVWVRLTGRQKATAQCLFFLVYGKSWGYTSQDFMASHLSVPISSWSPVTQTGCQNSSQSGTERRARSSSLVGSLQSSQLGWYCGCLTATKLGNALWLGVPTFQ